MNEKKYPAEIEQIKSDIEETRRRLARSRDELDKIYKDSFDDVDFGLHGEQGPLIRYGKEELKQRDRISSHLKEMESLGRKHRRLQSNLGVKQNPIEMADENTPTGRQKEADSGTFGMVPIGRETKGDERANRIQELKMEPAKPQSNIRPWMRKVAADESLPVVSRERRVANNEKNAGFVENIHTWLDKQHEMRSKLGMTMPSAFGNLHAALNFARDPGRHASSVDNAFGAMGSGSGGLGNPGAMDELTDAMEKLTKAIEKLTSKADDSKSKSEAKEEPLKFAQTREGEGRRFGGAMGGFLATQRALFGGGRR